MALRREVSRLADDVLTPVSTAEHPEIPKAWGQNGYMGTPNPALGTLKGQVALTKPGAEQGQSGNLPQRRTKYPSTCPGDHTSLHAPKHTHNHTHNPHLRGGADRDGGCLEV